MHNRWAYPGKPSSPSKRAASLPVLPLPSNWPASSTPRLRAYLNGTRLSNSGASSSAAGLAGTAQIEELHESASRLPPVSEAPDVAHSSARLDGHARQRDDVPAVGFACGYPLHGKSKQMAGRGSFAIDLALNPRFTRQGLGSVLFETLMNTSNALTHWLQTRDRETSTLRLCNRMGSACRAGAHAVRLRCPRPGEGPRRSWRVRSSGHVRRDRARRTRG